MSAEIVPLHGRRCPAPRDAAMMLDRPQDLPQAAPATRRQHFRREYTLADLIRLLKMQGTQRRTAIEKLRLLAEQCAMPLPKTPRIWRGRVQTGPAAIHARSVWCALEMDAWMDRGPAGTPDAVMPEPHRAAAVSPATRHAMRDRALNLRSVG